MTHANSTAARKLEKAADIDPITMEIIVHSLSAIPNLIDKNITRTAYSPIVSEYKDFSVGIVDADGRMIAQCRGGIPVFVANALSTAVRDGLKVYGKQKLQTGDVVIANHTAIMGQHLNNVVMYTPIRQSEDDGGLFGFLAVVMHWVDVGGICVGSCLSNDSTDVFQEGVQYPTVKVLSRGERVDDVFRIIRTNTRFPQMVAGDLEAQIAGCFLGRDMVHELLSKHGMHTVRQAVESFWTRCETAVQQAIRNIPDGSYTARSFLDNDGIHLDSPVRVNVAVHVSGDEITIDLSDVSEELRGPLNAGYEGGAVAAARIACKYFFSPDDPANDGAFRPIKVHCPPGTFLSARSTAPHGGSGSMLPTVVDTILRALGNASPGRVPAGHHGTYGLYVLFGRLPGQDQWFQHMESSIGGWGGAVDRDGPGPFRSIAHGDTLELPVELQEKYYPYRIESVRLRTDSAGPGKHRGGLGIVKEYHILDECSFTAMMERTQCPPWGSEGGGEGKPGRFEVVRHNGDGTPQVMLKGTTTLAKGDHVRVITAGGGGYGSVDERDTAAILQDLRNGFISREGAQGSYGLQFDDSGQPLPRRRPAGAGSPQPDASGM